MTFLRKYVHIPLSEASVIIPSITEDLLPSDEASKPLPHSQTELPAHPVAYRRCDERIITIEAEARALGWTDAQLWSAPVKTYHKALADVIKPNHQITAVTTRFIELTEVTVTVTEPHTRNHPKVEFTDFSTFSDRQFKIQFLKSSSNAKKPVSESGWKALALFNGFSIPFLFHDEFARWGFSGLSMLDCRSGDPA